jgi:hypothetical protein
LALLAAAGMTARALQLHAARPAPPPAPLPGDIEIRTEPPGCAIRLDGRYIGLSPLTARAQPPGEHFVEAQRAGHELRAARVELGPSGRRETLRLELAPVRWGRIEVTSDPPGATVMLDGEDRGVAPMTLENLAPGEHRLILRRARCEPWSRTLQLAPGETAQVKARLEDSFLRFLTGTVAADPNNVANLAMLFHYQMTCEDWKPAADSFLAAFEVMARERVSDPAKGGVWNWFGRDVGRFAGQGEKDFAARLGERMAELAARDELLAARAVRLMGGRGYLREAAARQPGMFRRVFFTAARRAAGSRAVAEAALEIAAQLRLADELKGLLAAAAEARPGDAEHLGWLAAKVVTLAAEETGPFRAEALTAAGEAVEKVLPGVRADQPVVRARLRRLLARIRLGQDRPERALEDIDAALAGLAAAGKAEAARAAAWRLDRAEILVALKRPEEARKILAELAADAPDAQLRKQAAAALAKLPPPAEKPPEPRPPQ